MADGEHPTSPPHPDVDPQAFRRTDLHGHRGPPRWRPRVRSAATHRRRRDDHLLPERQCVESRRPRRARPGDPATRLGRANRPAARQVRSPSRRPLEPGTGTATFAGADPEVNVTVSLPAGWEAPTATGSSPSRTPTADPRHVVGIGVGVGFVDVDNVFADPCRARLADPPVGQTVDDLVTALADLPGDATTRHRRHRRRVRRQADRVHAPRLHPRPRLRPVLSLAVRQQQRCPVPG